MFAQIKKRNIIPFPVPHSGNEHHATSNLNYRRRSSITTLPENILKLIWDNTSNGMRLTDSDGFIVAVNSSFCSLIHKQERELIGKEFTVMYSPDANSDKLHNNYSRSFGIGNFQNKYENIFRLYDNTIIEVEITETELLDNAQERYLLSEFRDISEQKRWERNVQESELNYRSLFDHAVMAMYQSSVEGRFINANNSMLALLGYGSLSELQSINIDTELYSNPKQREEVVELMRMHGEINGKELQLKKNNGCTIHVLLYSRAITVDSGTVTGYEGTLEDITFRKDAEGKISKYIAALETMQQELTALKSGKGKNIAVMSHDLRSPLINP